MRRKLANVEKQKGDVINNMIVEGRNSFIDEAMSKPFDNSILIELF